MKILIIRFSSIGDIVLTTPVARCLKQQLGATVHFLTKKSFIGLIAPNPNIDQVFGFDKHISEVLPALKREGYDHIVDLHHNLRSWHVKWSLRRPATSFDKLNLQKWLLVNTGINRLPDRHIVHRYLDTVKHLGVVYDGAGLDHYIPETDVVDLSTFSPLLAPHAFVAFVIGATHATKRLPREKMLEICRQYPFPMAILGGKAEMEDGAWIAAQAGDHVVDLCGKLSIHQSASVVAQSAVVLTHDTGLMHIAAALKKRVVAVWGSTVPAFGMFAFYPDGQSRNTNVECAGLSCRPCSKIGHNVCPKGHFNCMQLLDAAQIVAHLPAS
jgi:ADP-heptose:LPS heptosyltransferase